MDRALRRVVLKRSHTETGARGKLELILGVNLKDTDAGAVGPREEQAGLTGKGKAWGRALKSPSLLLSSLPSLLLPLILQLRIQPGASSMLPFCR